MRAERGSIAPTPFLPSISGVLNRLKFYKISYLNLSRRNMLLQDLSFYDVANFELVHIDLPKSLIVIVSKILQK